MRYSYFLIFGLFLLTACDKTDAPEANIHEPAGVPVAIASNQAPNKIKDGSYCFSKLLNQDVTNVELIIANNNVTGLMDWIPHEKDSARGTLQGAINEAGELNLMYDYMIEGNQQTETKVMKIEDGQLLIKVGELLDPKDDGNLVYKDVNQAKFSEVLAPVACK